MKIAEYNSMLTNWCLSNFLNPSNIKRDKFKDHTIEMFKLTTIFNKIQLFI